MAIKLPSDGSDDSGLAWGVNVTPLVDVCLVLVIIFIITAQAMMNEKLDITLPAAKQKDSERGVHITVTVDKDQRMTVNSVDVLEPWKVNLPQMIQEKFAQISTKAELRDQVSIIVRADKDCKYGFIREILENLREAGAARAYVATRGASAEK